MSPKSKKPAPEPYEVEEFRVTDIRRHHGDYDIVTAEPVLIVARRGPLGRSLQLKFLVDKYALQIGDVVGLGQVA